MTDQLAFEHRVVTLLRAIADEMPTGIDPMSMAHLAAAPRRSVGSVRIALSQPRLAFGLVLLAIALAFSLIGGALFVGGGPSHGVPKELLIEGSLVEPFTGLPPEGAVPSMPESGDLVLSFYGRVRTLDLDLHSMWLYADGRLVWKRNLDYESGYRLGQVTRAQRDRGEATARPVFGDSEPTSAVIEQRLTPEGVELMRLKVEYAGLFAVNPVVAGQDGAGWDRPGVLWGHLSVLREQGLVDLDWSGPDLPRQLADPGSWLPDTAWAERAFTGYVPSRYALCFGLGYAGPARPTTTMEQSEVMGLLPDPTRELISSRARPFVDPNDPYRPGCTLEVMTEDARLIVASLEAARAPYDPNARLRYYPPANRDASVDFLPILPDGEVVCYCG